VQLSETVEQIHQSLLVCSLAKQFNGINKLLGLGAQLSETKPLAMEIGA
jgi:hypothetical protein